MGSTKACSKCKLEKSIIEFHKSPSPLGMTSWCKTCCATKDKNRDRSIYYKSERYKQLNREANKRARLQAIEHYGGKCFCCGEGRYEFLTFHHVNGDGKKHRKETNNCQIGQWLRANKWPDGFDLLCWNCHQAEEHHGVCPHKREAVAI